MSDAMLAHNPRTDKGIHFLGEIARTSYPKESSEYISCDGRSINRYEYPELDGKLLNSALYNYTSYQDATIKVSKVGISDDGNLVTNCYPGNSKFIYSTDGGITFSQASGKAASSDLVLKFKGKYLLFCNNDSSGSSKSYGYVYTGTTIGSWSSTASYSEKNPFAFTGWSGQYYMTDSLLFAVLGGGHFIYTEDAVNFNMIELPNGSHSEAKPRSINSFHVVGSYYFANTTYNGIATVYSLDLSNKSYTKVSLLGGNSGCFDDGNHLYVLKSDGTYRYDPRTSNLTKVSSNVHPCNNYTMMGDNRMYGYSGKTIYTLDTIDYTSKIFSKNNSIPGNISKLYISSRGSVVFVSGTKYIHSSTTMDLMIPSIPDDTDNQVYNCIRVRE